MNSVALLTSKLQAARLERAETLASQQGGAVYFVPSAISITVTGLLFYFIYQPEIGLLDALLRQLGLEALMRPWLGDEHTAIYAIIAMSQWQGFGYSTLLFAVAIQKIPRELYDAAIIDGAGSLRRTAGRHASAASARHRAESSEPRVSSLA